MQLIENFTDQADYDKDMVTKYGYSVEQLSKPIRACLESGERQAITLEATNRRGRAITCSVTFNPLRDLGGGIDGVILVLDATEK